MTEKGSVGGRGYCPTDSRDFAGQGLRVLGCAAKDVQYLLDRGYPKPSAVTFCANHYLLSERQRTALMRYCASSAQLATRQSSELTSDDVRGAELHVDGFNSIITLETGLCGSVLLACADGTVRDLAGLRGTYRLIEQTGQAIELMGRRATALNLGGIVFWLDRPVSNSGRLASAIRSLWQDDWPRLHIEVVSDVDAQLAGRSPVATSDSVILDRAQRWYNLTKPILEERGVHLTALSPA